MAAKKAGIPVLLVDRSVDPSLAKAGEDYLAFIGSNFILEGQRVADWTIQKTGGKGKIIELEGSVGLRPQMISCGTATWPFSGPAISWPREPATAS